MSYIYKLLAWFNAKHDRKALKKTTSKSNNNAGKKIREPITYYGKHDKALKKMFYRHNSASSNSVVNTDTEGEGFLHGQKPH